MNIKAKALFYVSIASLVFSIVSLILDCVAYNPLGIAVSAFQIVVSIFGIVGGAILNKPVLVIGIVGASISILSHIVNFILLVIVVALVASQVPVWIAQVFFAAVSFAATVIMFSYLIHDTKRTFKGKSA
eukprot:TRINITY_DN8007_c0_g1_i1.p1 TRINITY_DN8007_c0_g1~~TRINITY_DN8007_c0_g1_i1.p1  ORF type:complete len:144 (-),score=15.04 TRINITY_DN8007_c0_g1_i1:199-588(-)